MTTPAARAHQSPLEDVLLDVHATLAELLVAADEQYAAVAARDHERLESVTRQQERLGARLARAEATRRSVLNGEAFDAAVAKSPGTEQLHTSIASSVRILKQKQAQTTSLLERSIAMTSHTLTFLQRLVAPEVPTYGVRPTAMLRQSLLVDGRA